MNKLTQDNLLALLSQPAARAQAALWVDPLNAAMEQMQINTPQRQAAFLAQVLHESGELQHLSENLSYSAARLQAVWPKRFPDITTAQAYANNPEKLANKVYAGRMGNGDEASGDGWKYRGRGLIQLTGRDNYTACSQALGLASQLVNFPDLASQPPTAAMSAAWFWNCKKLNELADAQTGKDGFIAITEAINGGTAGLPERLAYWDKAQTALA